MKVTLPYPPSANRYFRVFRGHAVLSAEAKAYKKQVAAILTAAGWKPAAGDVSYVAHVYRPLRSGDLDNRLKVLGDALTGFAWLDDKQVVELHAYRHDDKANPRVEMSILVLGEEAPKDAEVVPNPMRPRRRLKVPPKVQSAYRAAKAAEDLLPKRAGKCDCATYPGRRCGACKPGIVLGPATSPR